MPSLDDILISVGLRDNTGAPTARVQRRMDSLADSGRALGKSLSKALTLGPALAPAAAAAGALASTVGGAAVAVGALGAAVIPQIGAVTDAAEAHDKYNEAVRTSGKDSDEAKEALKEYQSQLDQMPAATQATAKEFIGLKKDFNAWSDSLAGDTMPIFTKGLQVLRTILPKLTPLVKGAAKIFSELMDRIQGKVESKSFDTFMKNMTSWALGGLRKTIDGITWLATTVSGFVMGEGFQKFLAMGEGSGANLGEIFQKLAQFVGAFIEAAGPFAGLSFLALEVLANALNAIPMGVLEVLAPIILSIAAAIKIYNIALAAYAIYQGLANAALLAFPVTWVVAAIVALIAIIVLLVLKWDWVKEKLLAIWDAIVKGLKAGWDWLVANVFAPIGRFFTQTIPRWAGMMRDGLVNAWNAAKIRVLQIVASITSWIMTKWNSVLSFFSSLPGKISGIASRMWNGLVSGFRSAINTIIGMWNNLSFTIGGGSVMGIDIPSLTLSTPNIPYLAEGGIVTGPTLAMVGEGREDEVVAPLSKLESMMNMTSPAASKVMPAENRMTIAFEDDTSDSFMTWLKEKIRIDYNGDVTSLNTGR